MMRDRSWFTLNFKNCYQATIWIVFMVVSLFSFINCLLDTNQPTYYRGLFLLPLAFAVCSLLCAKLYTEFFENFGTTLLLILLFVKITIHPLLMSISGYVSVVGRFANENMMSAIILMIYELIIIFAILTFKFFKIRPNINDILINKRKFTNKMYFLIVFTALIMLFFCIYIVPQIFLSYRTIFQFNDKSFTNFEDSLLVMDYATNTITKFAIVTGHYIIRVMLAILPAYIIISISKKKTLIRRCLSFFIAFIPLFIIGGTIAQSLIYTVCLFMLHFFIYDNKNVPKKMFYLLSLASSAVLAYWGYRTIKFGGESYYMNSASLIGAYFGGVNNVYGVFNIPDFGFFTKLLYFVSDYTNSVPYSGTILNFLHHLSLNRLFNTYNGVRGQIMPTIGSGWYYFGPIFAPIYSGIFAYISFNAGEKLKSSMQQNPIKIIRLLLTAIYFSMSIVMYNVHITLQIVFGILLPMYVIERMAYKK